MLFLLWYNDLAHINKLSCVSSVVYPKNYCFHELTEMVILLIYKNWFLDFMHTSKIKLNFHYKTRMCCFNSCREKQNYNLGILKQVFQNSPG